MEYTPKPVLTMERYSSKVGRQREKDFKDRMPKPHQDSEIILDFYRKLQEGRTGKDDLEDPDPYESTYIFYCVRKRIRVTLRKDTY